MIFCVNNENHERFDFDIDQLALDVGNEALTQGTVGLKTDRPHNDFLVNLIITDDKGIRTVNADTRGIDSPTDVLSFPAFSFETPGIFVREALDAFEVQDPETGGTWLGDIILNADRVRSQAAEFRHSEKREFAFLVAHAFFHLQGYDHETPEDAAVMEGLQDLVMENLDIPRDVISK